MTAPRVQEALNQIRSDVRAAQIPEAPFSDYMRVPFDGELGINDIPRVGGESADKAPPPYMGCYFIMGALGGEVVVSLSNFYQQAHQGAERERLATVGLLRLSSRSGQTEPQGLHERVSYFGVLLNLLDGTGRLRSRDREQSIRRAHFSLEALEAPPSPERENAIFAKQFITSMAHVVKKKRTPPEAKS